MAVRLTLALAIVALASNTGVAQSRTQNGATVGGVTGAVIGGIIGHQNDEVPEGALIGGAVGAIAGGLLGRAQDNDLARQRYHQHQIYQQQQQRIYAQQQAVVDSGISMTDVINMSRSGVSESLILSQMQSRGVQRRLEVNEIIALHQQGVSDTIIGAMQAAPLASQRSVAVQPSVIVEQHSDVIVRERPVIYRSPVIVEERYHPYPVYRHHYYGPRHRF